MSGGTMASSAATALHPGYTFRAGGLVRERNARRVRRFEIAPGRQAAAISVGGTEQFALPRLDRGLGEVDVYLGWFGPASRALAGGAVRRHRPALGRLPGATAAADGLLAPPREGVHRRAGRGRAGPHRLAVDRVRPRPRRREAQRRCACGAPAPTTSPARCSPGAPRLRRQAGCWGWGRSDRSTGSGCRRCRRASRWQGSSALSDPGVSLRVELRRSARLCS